MTTLTLPKWYDLHVHLRQDGFLKPLIQAQLDMGCCGVLAMPNTKPPLAKVLRADPSSHDSIENYLEQIRAAGGNIFTDIIVPLYLTKDTTPKMIEEGAKSGVLRAAKYYPPHGTTNSDFGHPAEEFISNGVFKAMEEAGVVLCLHGEMHGQAAEDYFDKNTNAEEAFYKNVLPKIHGAFPKLKIACEHITTKVAVDFVIGADDTVAASITPQHLLYTVGHLLKGCQYHLYCLPLLKYEQDRAALRDAVLDRANTKFYAGTDSAPHTKKATACGCAAGCFTGGYAPQLYAQAFEEAGADLSNEAVAKTFENFLCHNGANFYGLEKATQTFMLTKSPQKVEMLEIQGEGIVTPLPLGIGVETIPWALSLK